MTTYLLLAIVLLLVCLLGEVSSLKSASRAERHPPADDFTDYITDYVPPTPEEQKAIDEARAIEAAERNERWQVGGLLLLLLAGWFWGEHVFRYFLANLLSVLSWVILGVVCFVVVRMVCIRAGKSS